ncbi:hypothetical protein J1N35_005248 [Gossypium stocksii]|uniref:Uncharacterized protein n=1 Tax=Gossypium stocksii TaxID=47602 RepID=A0A9D4AIT4_9ROSI|nr:hypothetical protein J1N35_005248 [Gossypium stocksii]
MLEARVAIEKRSKMDLATTFSLQHGPFAKNGLMCIYIVIGAREIGDFGSLRRDQARVRSALANSFVDVICT